MIGKLIAHEAHSTRKTLLITVGILLLISALGVGLGVLDVPVLGVLGYVFGVILIVLITPVVLGLLAENYWRTMYGREGYFTMALPVRGRALFTAKVLFGVVATVVAFVLSALALLGISVVLSVAAGHPPLTFVRDTVSQVGASMVWFLVLMLLFQLMFAVVTGAAMMSIGAEGRFNHLGFGAPVLGYVLLYVAMQVLGLAAMLFVPLGIVLMGPDAGTIVAQGMLSDFIASLTDTTGNVAPNVLGLGILPLGVVVAALFAWWGGRSVERHTSLR